MNNLKSGFFNKVTTKTLCVDGDTTISGDLVVDGIITGAVTAIKDSDDTTSITTTDIAETITMTTNSLPRAVISSVGNFIVDTNTFYVDAVNDRIGINSVPSYPLEVNAGITGTIVSFYGPSAGRELRIDNSSTNFDGDTYTFNAISTGGEIAFATNAGTERMRICNGGDIGIGTTTPSVELEVNGEIKTEICSTIGTLGFILLDRQNVSVPTSFGTCIFDLDNQSTDEFAMYKFIFRGRFDGSGVGTGAIDLQFRDTDGAMATAGGHIKYLRRENNTIQYAAVEGTDITISYIDDPSNASSSTFIGELIISTGVFVHDCNLIGHSMYRAASGLLSIPEIQRSDFNGAIWDTESVNTRITGFSLRRSGSSQNGNIRGSVFRMM